jgi:glycosyltransferase involved in cell wall biosynthesis
MLKKSLLVYVMNLLFVHERLGSFGGAEANLFATASEFRRRGHRVGLLAQQRTGRNEENWEKVFGQDIWLDATAIAAVTRGFGFELAYVHKWQDLPSTTALLAGGLPLVRMVHDHDLYCLRSYRYHPLSRRICHRPLGLRCIFPCLAPVQRNHGGGLPIRWASFTQKRQELALAKEFQRNIVATPYMRDELLLNGFDPARIKIHAPVPPPVEPLTSQFSPRNLLVFAGQLIRGKGVDVLLRALAKVKSRFEAVILGEGGQRAACERLCRQLGLQDRVSFHGFIPAERLRAFYQEATAVLVPSVWPEPMGLVGLEAMRFSLPVVAFNAGGVSAWLRDGENGFLVPWMDIERFAAAVDILLTDKVSARAMGARGFARANRDFDFGDYIGGLEDLFERVILEHSGLATCPRNSCAPA